MKKQHNGGKEKEIYPPHGLKKLHLATGEERCGKDAGKGCSKKYLDPGATCG